MVKTELQAPRAKKDPQDTVGFAEEKAKPDLPDFQEKQAYLVREERKRKGRLASKDKLAILEKREAVELMEYLVNPAKFLTFRQSQLMGIQACAVTLVHLECQGEAVFLALQDFLVTLVNLENAARLDKPVRKAGEVSQACKDIKANEEKWDLLAILVLGDFPAKLGDPGKKETKEPLEKRAMQLLKLSKELLVFLDRMVNLAKTVLLVNLVNRENAASLVLLVKMAALELKDSRARLELQATMDKTVDLALSVRLAKRVSQASTEFLDQLVAAERKENRASLGNLFEARLVLLGLMLFQEKMEDRANSGLKVQQDLTVKLEKTVFWEGQEVLAI